MGNTRRQSIDFILWWRERSYPRIYWKQRRSQDLCLTSVQTTRKWRVYTATSRLAWLFFPDVGTNATNSPVSRTTVGNQDHNVSICFKTLGHRSVCQPWKVLVTLFRGINDVVQLWWNGPLYQSVPAAYIRSCLEYKHARKIIRGALITGSIGSGKTRVVATCPLVTATASWLVTTQWIIWIHAQIEWKWWMMMGGVKMWYLLKRRHCHRFRLSTRFWTSIIN